MNNQPIFTVMNNQPKVSIVMPAFNSAKYIEEAILSVLKQSYRNFELIIVNDCSTDETLNLINKFKQIDNRIILIDNLFNLGVVSSRNKAIEVSSGSFLAFLDSDDIWLPNKLDIQIYFMLSNNYNFSFTQYEIFKDYDPNYKKIVKVPMKLNYNQAIKWTIIGCLTVVYNVDKLGKFKMPDLKHGEDSFTWLSILKTGTIAYGIQETLAKYRKLKKSRSSNKLQSLKLQFFNYHKYLKINFYKSIWLTTVYSIRAFFKHL
jgi:teichuronic acid biosynthesis glycosyltransferase TuaG